MNDNQNNDNYDNRPGGELRIGDAERNEAVRLLGEHYEAGRLSQEEHSERIETALQAGTRRDLDALFTDLPRDAGDPGWQGPGQYQAGAQSGPQSGPQRGAQEQQGWQGWFGGPQRSGPQQGGYRSGGPAGGPPWARGGWRGPRGPFGLPIPLIAILAVATLAGIACTVAGGHPPVLLFLALGATAFAIVRRRRFGAFRA